MQSKKVLLYLFIIILITGCGSKKQNIRLRPEMKIGKIAFLESITKKDFQNKTLSKKIRFSSDINKIYAVINIENFSGVHKISWKWYTPKNRLYLETKQKKAYTKDQFYIKQLSSYNYIDINGYEAEDYKGKWRVEFYLNNKFETSASFYINN